MRPKNSLGHIKCCDFLDPPFIVFPHLLTGKAFVIFKKKCEAESAISELNKRCLSLGEGRYCICCFVFHVELLF